MSTSQNKLIARVIMNDLGQGHIVRTHALMAQFSTLVQFTTEKLLEPDFLLIDAGYRPYAWWEEIRKIGKPAIVIDDEGGPVYADMIINGTPCGHHYPNAPRAVVLAGPRYALLRPEFARTKWDGGSSGRAFVHTGSGEAAERWREYIVSHHQARFRVPDEPMSAQEIATKLSEATVAFVTGGMGMYEAMAVGVPTVVFPQVPNLVQEAAWFDKAGAIINLGPAAGFSAEVITAALNQINESPGRALITSNLLDKVVDGNGVSRVVDRLWRLLSSTFPQCAGSAALCGKSTTEHDVTGFDSAELL